MQDSLSGTLQTRRDSLRRFARLNVSYQNHAVDMLADVANPKTVPDGSWYPGMMYADFLTIHSPQPVQYYYLPSRNDLYHGGCADAFAFTAWGPRRTITGKWG